MKFPPGYLPYRQNNNFNKLVRQFDVNSGFAAVYDDPDQTIPAMSLQERIDLGERELRQARDLYAYLAVYAPEARMRADNGTDSVRAITTKSCSAPRRRIPTHPIRPRAARCSIP
ncbi:MAG: hypothetical protein R2932_44410 [Caldilineaceae bacterium]